MVVVAVVFTGAVIAVMARWFGWLEGYKAGLRKCSCQHEEEVLVRSRYD